jgi:cell division transport system permease protein
LNLNSIEYVIQEAFAGIRRNGVMAFASITTVALSLTVLGAFVLAAMGARNFAAVQLREFEIAVFMNKGITEADTAKIADDVRKIAGVKSVSIRSREEEWRRFKLETPEFESAGTSASVLPNAMDVRVGEPSQTVWISSKIRAMKSVHEVNFADEDFDRVMSVIRVIRGTGTLGAIVLLIVTAMIISNAIRLTLYARRAEIRTMQLVGATNEFIRIPLVIEGILFGAIGAAAAWALLRLMSTYISKASLTIPSLRDLSAGIGDIQLLFGLMIVGAVIGAVGSWMSIRRFLHD